MQRLLVDQPKLREEGPIVLQEKSRSGWRVVECSSAALERGLRPGMSVAEATAVVGASLHVQTHDPAADVDRLRQLAQSCECFTPVIGLEETDRPECLFLDVTGCTPFFRSEEALADLVAKRFCEWGWSARIALADTVGASWAVARFLKPSEPGFVSILPSGRMKESLAPLPIAGLRLPDDILHLLNELGLERIEQLLVLSRASLAARFEPILMQRLDQALGRLAEPVNLHRSFPDVRTSWTFEPPTDYWPGVETVLERLVERLVPVVAARQQGVTRLRCRFEGERSIDIDVDLYQPSVDPDRLLSLLRLRLEGTRNSQTVERVELEVRAMAPLLWRQQDLFGGDSGSSEESVHRLIEQLSNRLGRSAVVGAQTVADPSPENACAYEPMVLGWRRRSRPAPAARPEFCHRPVRLYAKPLPLRMIERSPAGLPARFLYNGREYVVGNCWGPERIETGWWRGRMTRRDYYRIETSTGARLWLFSSRHRDQWFLHGCFN